MKRVRFGPQGDVEEVEFFDRELPGLAAVLAEHEKEISSLMAELPEDLRARMMKKRDEQLTYASSL